MKKTPIEPEASAAWRAALARFDEDLRRRGAAQTMRRAYAADLRQFAAWASWQAVAPAAVTDRVLRRYAAAMAERRSAPATVVRKLAALGAFFETLREHGEIEANPAALLAIPTSGAAWARRDRGQRGEAQPRELAPEQISRLLDRIPASTPLELRDRALFEIACSCGLRAEELVALDVTSVDFDAGALRVAGKGSEARLVTAGEPALRALARYLQRARAALAHDRDEVALFVSKSGRRLSTSDIRRRLRVCERHASVQGAGHPGALRDSLATHLLEGGADPRSIQKLLGQTSMSSTRIYTRVESARLKHAYARSHPRA